LILLPLAETNYSSNEKANQRGFSMSADSNLLHGVFPALFTPLQNDDPKRLKNSIDYEKARMMIDDLIARGVQGIVPVGTTGQSATVSTAQHLDFIKFVLEYVDGRLHVIAGAGSNCTRESVEMIQEIQKIAQVPVLCATGYYNNPDLVGLKKHFETLADETGAKIVLYNVPGRTNSYMTPELITELASHSGIIGLKQAVDFKIGGEFREDTLSIIQNTKEMDFAVLSGEDDSLTAILELGGKGMISATANLPEAAEMYVKAYNEFRAGNKEAAESMQIAVLDYVEACFSRKNPIPLGTFFNSPMFLPLVSVKETEGGEELHQQLMEMVETRLESLKKYH